MALLNFPNTRQNGSSLQNGDVYTGDNGVTYIYNTGKWTGYGDGFNTGTAATIRIGTVTTGSASVTNTGSIYSAYLNFTIPQGLRGDIGPQGDTGAQGISLILVGSTDTVSVATVGPGAPGQGWIGTNTGHVYFWNTLTTLWEDIGPIVGPAGPRGLPGSQGDQGPIGPSGATGPQGEQGTQGPQGVVGPRGATGAIGPSGPQGNQGAQGNQGLQGNAGLSGVQGVQGPQGTQGPQGPYGLSGPQGPQGNQGSTGSQGTAGYTGSTGASGPQGDQGPQGPYGLSGPQGPRGATGTQGPQGSQGPSGVSGPQGSQGPSGVSGPQGPQGVNGDTGATGPQGATGANSTVSGPQGPQGPSGADGTSVNILGQFTTSTSLSGVVGPALGDGYIVSFDGHLWVYTGTGAVSGFSDVGQITGPIGPQGPTGAQGNQGLQGSTGSPGNNGVQGPQGPQGPQGAEGPQGVSGPSGATGADGSTGATGPAADLGKFVIVNDPGLAYLSTTGTGYDIVIAATQGEGAQYISIPNNENAALGNNLIIGTSTATSAVRIESDTSAWTFGTDGVITLPPDGIIKAPDNDGGTSAHIKFYAAGGEGYDDNTSSTSGDIDIVAGVDGGYDNDNTYGNFNIGNIRLKTSAFTGQPVNEWKFGWDGSLTFPNSATIYQTGPSVDLQAAPGGWAELANSDNSQYVWVDDVGTYIATNWTATSHTWTFAKDGIMSTPGHLIPNTDLAYDLGSTSSQWRSIYVGTGTVYIGGVALGVNADNYVTVDGNPIITINTAGNLTIQGDVNIGTVTVSDTAPTATTGTQWFDTVEGRTYVATDGLWLDASPTQIPSPETYLDGLAIDGTVIGTANVDGDAIVIDGGDNTKLTVSNNSVTIQVPGSLTRPYWAAEFGGITTAVTTSSLTIGTGAFYDSQGNVYVLGAVQFDSNEFFGLDSLLLKYDTNGNLLWSRTWHDDSGANCGAVNQAFAIDSNDKIYWLATAVEEGFGCWTGYMDTEGNLGLGGVAQGSLGFLDGNFAGADIACDNSGNYYLAGVFFDYVNNTQTPVVIKVDGDNGVPIWTGSIVPEDFEDLPADGQYRAVTVNPATGDVWAIGDYYDGGLRAMLSKWDINGSHQWTKELVTTTGDVASAVIYNGGYVYTIVNDDPDQKAVVSKFDTDGVLIWASFLAVGALDPIPTEIGSYSTGAYDLSFDASGNVYVTGTIPGPPAGQPQLWITKLDPANGEMLYSRMLATTEGSIIVDQGFGGGSLTGHRVGDIYQDTIVVTAVTESDIDDSTGTGAFRVIVAQLPIDGSVTGTFDNIDIIDLTGDIDGISSTGTYTVTTLVWSTGTSTAIYSTSSISVSYVTDIVGLTGETIALGSGTAGGTTTTNTWTFVNNNIILPPGGDILDSDGNSVLGVSSTTPLPSWITVVSGTEHLPTLNTDYGWDSSGAWTVNATILENNPEGTSYPFRTTFSIPNDTKSVTTVDFVVDDFGADFGIGVFATGTSPVWQWPGLGGGNPNRIGAQYNGPNPELHGISGGDDNDYNLPGNGTYRARLTVLPTDPGVAIITLETLDTSDNVLDTITYEETSFFGTSYKIGFASDQDSGTPKTYFKNLTINIDNGATVYTDTLMNGNSVGGSTTALGDRLTAGSNSVVLSSTGTLTLPNGGVISEVGGAFGGAIRLEPSGASSSTQALVIYPTAGVDGNHIHLTAGGGGTDLYLGDDDQYVKVDHSGDIVVGTVGANTSTWTFGTDGVLTLSTASTILGNSEDPNVYIETATTSTTSTWTFGTNGILTLPAATPVIKGGGTGTDVTVVASTGSNTSTWTFAADGGLTLPNGMIIDASDSIPTVTIGGPNTKIRIDDGGAPPGFYITTNATSSTAYGWLFGPDGELEFPQGSTISETIATTGTHGTTIIQAGTNNDLLLNTWDYVNSTIRTWNFGIDGALTFPDSTVQTTAYTGGGSGSASSLTNGSYSVSLGSDGVLTFSGEGGATLSNDGEFRIWTTSTDITVYRNGQDGYGVSEGEVNVFANNNNITKTTDLGFEIVQGYLKFPDATVQTTAFTGTIAYSNITDAPTVVNKTSGSWTLVPGANTVSITVAPGGNYQMWVNGNIPNGIVTWNATVSTSNTNVPVVGSQYGWYYAAGNMLVLTSMPNQIVGTAGSISTATISTTTSNVFRFGITNNSVSTQTVYWGYTTL